MFTNADVCPLDERRHSICSCLLKIAAIAMPVSVGAAFLFLTSNAIAREITLTWDPSPTQVIGGYDVHWGLSSGSYPYSVDVGDATTYTLTALDDTETYYIAVATYDTTGEYQSDFSNEVTSEPSGGGPGPVEDTTAPDVTVSSPESGSTANGKITLAAFATDDVGAIQISISVNGVVQCVGTSYATCDWHAGKAGAGTHTISARAQDAAGNVGTDAAEVTVPEKGGGKGKASRTK